MVKGGKNGRKNRRLEARRCECENLHIEERVFLEQNLPWG
jgi:hypothetical protein